MRVVILLLWPLISASLAQNFDFFDEPSGARNVPRGRDRDEDRPPTTTPVPILQQINE